MSEIIIKLNNDDSNANVSITDEKGVVRNKNIAIESLIESLVSNYKLSTDIVPFGTRYYRGASACYNIFIETSANIKNINISRRNSDGSKIINESFKIPFPQCLFSFKVVNTKLTVTKVFALKHAIQTEEDTLYHFPFTNVYEDGKICWNNIKLPIINKPLELVTIISMFNCSSFNDDLYRSQDKARTFWDLITQLKNCTTFPLDFLIKSRINFRDLKGE